LISWISIKGREGKKFSFIFGSLFLKGLVLKAKIKGRDHLFVNKKREKFSENSQRC